MDLTQISSNLKVKTDFNAGSALGLRDANSIIGIVDNSVTSIQALIFSNKDPKYEDFDPTNFDVTGMQSGYDKKCFIFDLKKDYKLNLNSDITDHYVEDNVAIQDHIGLKPLIIEVNGVIGEITLKDTKIDETKDNDDSTIFNEVDSYLNRMGSLTSFAPNIVNQAMDIYETVRFGYQTVNGLINTFTKDDNEKKASTYTEKYDEDVIAKTQQFKWIDWFKRQWQNRASFTIITPYGKFDNMYIMDLSASQPEQTRYLTNLSIKFKHIRKANIISSGTKQVSQPMDTRRYRTGRDNEPPTTVIDDISTDAIPLDNKGGVTQVTAEEFEKVNQKVQTLNVKEKTGMIPYMDRMLNNGAFAGVKFVPMVGI